MLSKAVEELEVGLVKLNKITYDSIDKLMRKIMKSYGVTAKELHNSFKNKHKKTPDDWIKEKMKKLNEDHKEISSGKKTDDEGYMARNELDSIENAVKNLRRSIKSGKQQLPAWVQSKITKAADYIDTAAEYLQSDEKVDEETSFTIGSEHKKASKQNKITKKIDSPGTAGESNAAKNVAQKLGGTGAQLPNFRKEEISLVEKILGEEKCGKGMYWCNTDKVCKPLPTGLKVPGQKIKPTEVGIGKAVDGSCTHTGKGKKCPVHGMNECPVSEEKDPKGPTQPYKTVEEIARKHGVSLAHIEKQIKMGTKVELEHTSDKQKAKITALQHLDELPDYYSKLKKMETQKESTTVRDANGNFYAEFIDIIKAGTIEEENPVWTESKNKKGKEQGIDGKACWKNYRYAGTENGKDKCVKVNEATRMPSKTGNNLFVTLSWRGKYYSIQIFFPQAKVPSRAEISYEIEKIYPGSKVVTYRISELKPGEPLLYANQGGDRGKPGSNKNYVKTMGEEVEILDEKK
jgi:hypothetical protein